MACLGLRSGGGITTGTHQVKIPGHSPTRVSRARISPAPAALMVAKCTAIKVAEGRSRTHVGGGPEKLDRWMRESVGEIVKNLREAPLFVHVYGGEDRSLKAEKAVAEDWAHLKGKWAKGEEPSPEGIILVEELKEDEMGIFEEDEGQNGESTKAWGVLIQGKGEDGGVACYLLKTSRVGCSNMGGLFCTHYCLVRVKSFRETARSQLTNCWLV